MKIINDTYKGTIRYIVGQTEGVCSQAIELLIDGDVILDVAFHGGCNGNLKGIASFWLTFLECKHLASILV